MIGKSERRSGGKVDGGKKCAWLQWQIAFISSHDTLQGNKEQYIISFVFHSSFIQ
jgi:hypothetical protein